MSYDDPEIVVQTARRLLNVLKEIECRVDEYLEMTPEERVFPGMRGIASNHGLCSAIHRLDDLVTTGFLATDLMQLWPDFSGDENYPVPGDSAGAGAAVDAYVHARYEKWVGSEYAKRRRDLLYWMIDTLEEWLEEV
jgi:hypothetical protein